MIEWEEIVDDESQEPWSYSLSIGYLLVVIFEEYNDEWGMECEGLGINITLKAETADDAKAEALKLVRHKLNELNAALKEIEEAQ